MNDIASTLRPDSEVAVVGMEGRFPGASCLQEFWANLCGGVESISTFSEDQLKAFGVPPAVFKNPDFVSAGPILDSVEDFDAEFFGYSSREAELMDPQHRVFLECSWAAIESAGYSPDQCPPLTGVYAGSSLSSYLLYNLMPSLRDPHAEDSFQAMIGNDKDFLCSRVSYKLNLHGPSVTVQTGCSTSLVAIHLACQSLLSYQCDMALAGGVSVQVPARLGYLYQRGGLTAPDGHCRAFDARAEGTLFGSGAGVVVLKRLNDALADRDSIYAVIKGSAVNNDGIMKVGYTAPSIAGQAAVIRSAHALAEIDPASIGYVECHGTGTALGDPVEIQALIDAFGGSSRRPGPCAIGSVKTNIGHLDAAAGVAAFIKTVLILKNKMLPPSLHFEAPNPRIDFEGSSFRVNTKLRKWESNGTARRAGVSSFGIGGTNAHVVLQEAPPESIEQTSREYKLLVLSAKTQSALDQQTANLAQHLRIHDKQDLADIAFTTQTGRSAFEYRRAIVCRDREQAIEALEGLAPQRVFSAVQELTGRGVVFMFPGGGAQHVNMAADLYRAEPVFMKEVDRCSELLRQELDTDLRSCLYPEKDAANTICDMRQASIGLPALFVIEYAAARLLMSWGVRPDALIGHSLGEYVAACVAGVFSLKDALSLVLTRSRLLQKAPRGAMLSVPLSKEDLRPILNDKIWLAAVNGPSQSVVSGTVDAIEEITESLKRSDIEFRKIAIDVSSHSGVVAESLSALRDFLLTIELRPPQIPFISNCSGTWMQPQDATNPDYWVRHMRSTVLFSDGIAELCKVPGRVFLEVGPGHTLTTLARAQVPSHDGTVVINSLRHPYEKKSDLEVMTCALGKLWAVGAIPDWHSFSVNESRCRVSLPSYPFQRRRYWIQPNNESYQKCAPGLAKGFDIDQWFYAEVWKGAGSTRGIGDDGPFLVFAKDQDVGSQIVHQLRLQGKRVVTVLPGGEFRRLSDNDFEVNVLAPDDYVHMFDTLRESGNLPQTVIHTWSTGENLPTVLHARKYPDRDRGFYSVLFLVQAMVATQSLVQRRIFVVTDGSQAIESVDSVVPEKALLTGLCKVVTQECEPLQCNLIDVALGQPTNIDRQVEVLLGEITSHVPEPVVAIRGSHRWVQRYEPLSLSPSNGGTNGLRDEGVYLITGGLGNIGMILAEHLFKEKSARLVLTTRTKIPPRALWSERLTEDGGDAILASKLQKLSELEASGAQILVLCTDVSDPNRLSQLKMEVKRRFGAINGIFHLAGKTGKEAIQLISSVTPTDSDEHFNAKLEGTKALYEVFGADDLDFALLFSSNASVLGGMGLASYAAANSALDAYPQVLNIPGKSRWIAINWDRWGLERDSNQIPSGLDAYAMTIPEAIGTLYKIIASASGERIIVSTGDLNDRLRVWVRRKVIKNDGDTPIVEKTTIHSRPLLDIDYAPPCNDVEDKIAGIWQEILGIDRVGRNDNFFELGGNSLMALKVASCLHRAIGVQMPVVLLFEGPTVSSLAKLITGAQDWPGDIGDSQNRGLRRREM